MKHYNIKSAVSVELTDFEKSNLHYVPERKTWLGKVIPEHLEQRYGHIVCRIPMDRYSNLIIRNNVAYILPEIIIKFSDGQELVKSFKTYHEAKVFESNILEEIGRNNFITDEN